MKEWEEWDRDLFDVRLVASCNALFRVASVDREHAGGGGWGHAKGNF